MKEIFYIISLYCVLTVNCRGIKEEFTWTRINYVWPRESRYGHRPTRPNGNSDFAFPGAVNTVNKPTQSDSNQDNGVAYIYENNIPMGANRWNDKLFITIPRRRNGVPSTLNYVSLKSRERHNVPLIPYPNWDTNQLNAPADQRLVSTYRVAIDPCDRLWLIDTGIIEIPGNRTDIQPHSIVIIDLKTDQIIHRYTLKDSVVRPATILSLITVDVTADKCENAYAYMPDLAGYGLIVYGLQENDSWRVNHNYFYLEPLAGDFNIGGQQFQWNDGVFSIALSNIKGDGYRDAFFHSMAGFNLYKVSTKILRNESLATRSYHGSDFINMGNRGPLQQTSASDLHQPTGVLFLNLVNQNALGCWNINKPFSPENFDIIQKDDEKMIYPCDAKVYNDEVIIITNNMPIFLYSQLNYDEINFRVWISNVQDTISGTKCDFRKGSSGHRYGYNQRT